MCHNDYSAGLSIDEDNIGLLARAHPSRPTRTHTTTDRYLSTAERLRCASAKSHGVGNVAWEAVVADLVGSKERLAAATFRQYKAALVVALEGLIQTEPFNQSLRESLICLSSESQTACVKKPSRTSASKAKRFTLGDRETIYSALDKSRSPRARLLAHFIRAACCTGLRPIEWRRTTLVPPEFGVHIKLSVQNAKATNGRANGARRTLRWSSMSDHAKESIEAILALAGECATDGEFDTILRALDEVLHDVARRLWPRRVRHCCLYSCRHEFAAQAKTVYSPAEVAALMGHGDDRTAASHYGRPSRSKRAIKLNTSVELELPKPDQGEVATVRLNLGKSLDRLRRVKVRMLDDPGAEAVLSANPDSDTLVSADRFVIEDFPVPSTSSGLSEDVERANHGSRLWAIFRVELNRDFDLDGSVRRLRERAKDLRASTDGARCQEVTSMSKPPFAESS
jgi:hypothetical protein